MANEQDFFHALSDRETRAQDGAEFMKKLKTASASDVVKMTTGFIRAHAPEVAAALVGGVAATAGQYVLNRAPKGKKSVQQLASDAALEASSKSIERSHSSGEPVSMKQEMTHSTSRYAKDLADTFAKHPVKGALLAAPVGASAGLAILKKLK